MRLAFYGDDNDLWKWTIVLREAAPCEVIYYVPIWDGNEECPDKFPHALQPFEMLPDSDARIYLWSAPFCHRNRAEYFSVLTQNIVRSRHAMFLLVDPDTGLAEVPSQEHISYEEVKEIWRCAPSGSRLMVYQHNTRRPDWGSTEAKRIEASLGVTTKVYKSSQAAFLVTGMKTSASSVSSAVAGL